VRRVVDGWCRGLRWGVVCLDGPFCEGSFLTVVFNLNDHTTLALLPRAVFDYSHGEPLTRQ